MSGPCIIFITWAVLLVVAGCVIAAGLVGKGYLMGIGLGWAL